MFKFLDNRLVRESANLCVEPVKCAMLGLCYWRVFDFHISFAPNCTILSYNFPKFSMEGFTKSLSDPSPLHLKSGFSALPTNSPSQEIDLDLSLVVYIIHH